jgi:hypothetical protein
MLNPSLHMSTLTRVLKDCAGKYNVEGALAHFIEHEQDAIGHALRREDAARFRAACIRSPFYGRVFLWMVIEGYSTAPANDESALLARTAPHVQTGVPWKGGWKPVSMLRKCTGAHYVDLGCGPMLYWRQVLSANPTYLFEIDLTSLQQLAATLDPMPDSMHVIPCDWTGLAVSDIVGPRACAVLSAYRPGTDLPPPGDCKEAYYMLADCADYETPMCEPATTFMSLHASSRWKLHTNNIAAEKKAALAQQMYSAM